MDQLLYTTIRIGYKETQATIVCYHTYEKTHQAALGKQKGYIRIENKDTVKEKVTVFIPSLHPLVNEFRQGKYISFLKEGKPYKVGMTEYILDFVSEIRNSPISA